MPYKPSSTVRCFVIAATYMDFDSFCHKMKVNPKAKDIICILPDTNWTKHLTGLYPDQCVFVFLQGWARNSASGVAFNLVRRVNTITMKSEEPYKREIVV